MFQKNLLFYPKTGTSASYFVGSEVDMGYLKKNLPKAQTMDYTPTPMFAKKR